MDMKLLNALSGEQKREYMAVMRTLEDTGWEILSKHFGDLAEQLVVAGANASTWDENRIILGRRIAYLEFANLREGVEAQFEQLAQEIVAATNPTEDDEDYE